MDDKLSDTEDTVNLNDVINSYTRTTGGGGGVINAAGATFITDGVKPGDLVVNTTTGNNDGARIISVDSERKLHAQSRLHLSGTPSILSQHRTAVLYVGTAAAEQLKVRSAGAMTLPSSMCSKGHLCLCRSREFTTRYNRI